jgi:hypothetical protein
LAKRVVYLAPGILAKLDADPAIRQAVPALMERAMLSWQPRLVSRSGPICSVPVRSRDRRLPRPVRGFEEGRTYRFFLTARTE